MAVVSGAGWAGLVAGWEHPLFNAAGTVRTLEQVRAMARSAVSAVLVGSITMAPRQGNAGVTWAAGEGWTVNALGMPNVGAVEFAGVLPQMVQVCAEAGKALVVSVAGFSPVEYGRLARVAAEGGASAVELNLGCPNVWGEGGQHRIVAFDPELVVACVRQALEQVAACGRGVPVGVKLSPYSDPGLLAEVAAAVGESGVGFVTSCNTFPNALVLAEGRPVLGVGLGGLAGGALKQIALGQVAQLRAALPGSVAVVGVGGVRCWADVEDLLAVGASSVQAASAFFCGGESPGVFGDILAS